MPIVAPGRAPSPPNFQPFTNFRPRTPIIAVAGGIILLLLAFNIVSVQMGGHMMGPTFVQPGNVGLVIDNYNGTIERSLMPAGTHWQGPWETVIEVPTAQRTISMAGQGQAVQVNTISNMLSVDVSAQYLRSRLQAQQSVKLSQLNYTLQQLVNQKTVLSAQAQAQAAQIRAASLTPRLVRYRHIKDLDIIGVPRGAIVNVPSDDASGQKQP